MKINFRLKDKKVNIDKYVLNKKKMLDKYKIKYYTLFIFMILLSVVTIKTNLMLNENLNEEAYVVFNSEDKIDNDEYQDDHSNNRDTRFKDVIKVINSNSLNNRIKVNKEKVFDKNVNNQKVNNQKVVATKELKFICPLQGKIIKNYSEDLVYSNTLDMWKVHDGIDIKGELNKKIMAVEDGTIERKFEDSFYGNTVIIKHRDGYKSIYCNVSSNLKVNDYVKKYQEIGNLDNSSVGEFKDEYHLHFMMKYNDKIINPNEVIKF